MTISKHLLVFIGVIWLPSQIAPIEQIPTMGNAHHSEPRNRSQGLSSGQNVSLCVQMAWQVTALSWVCIYIDCYKHWDTRVRKAHYLFSRECSGKLYARSARHKQLTNTHMRKSSCSGETRDLHETISLSLSNCNVTWKLGKQKNKYIRSSFFYTMAYWAMVSRQYLSELKWIPANVSFYKESVLQN